ncbi:recombinase family protein [Parafrankia sp. BMG5.11]|uniref:recombinase family protein n=1 Tax=Parafrankia sp. BMG5.11 TaxID=222540 RepID=UPI001A9D019F|nr:recombinase family protein [Parafrankia sp. BMG5.11]
MVMSDESLMTWDQVISEEARALLAELLARDPVACPVPVGIYGRISQDDEHDAKGVARQIMLALKRIAAEPTWRLAVRPMVDNDISASKRKRRPEYERLATAVDDGSVAVVVVYMTGRLWRNRIERANALETWAARRIRIVATKGQDLDLSSSSGRVVAGLLGELDTYEIEQMSERHRDESDQRAQAGLPPGGRCYGYGTKRTINDDEAEIIRFLADRVLINGHGLGMLAAEMTDAGVPTVRAKTWTVPALRGILTNPALAGLRVHRGEVIGAGTWEPILSVDTHHRLVARLRHRMVPPGWSNRPRHLLSGIAVCGKCTAPLLGRAQDGRMSPTYLCPPPERGGCRGIRRVSAPIDLLVETTVVELLGTPGVIEQWVSADAAHAAEVLALSAQGDAARARAAALGVEMAGDDPSDEITKIMRRSQVDTLRAELEQIRRKQAAAAYDTAFDGLLAIEDIAAHWPTLGLPRRRAIIRALVTVEILPGRRGRGGFDPDTVRIERRTREQV